MVALLYLKHAFNESDEDVIQRWGETPTWQYFSGSEYFQHQWPCDPTQLGRFRKALGEEGVEELLARTMEVAVTLRLIVKKGLDLLLCLLQASGLAGLLEKLAEIFGRNRLQNSAQRWVLA